MLIKKLSAIAAISGFCTLASTGFADETAELKEMLLKQQKQIEMLQKSANQLQQKVEKQETVHNEALTHYIKNEIDRALEAKGSNLLTLGSNVENLTIKGDFRLRYEDTTIDAGGDRDRFRMRFRLGFLWETNEGWEIGAGLATGGVGNNSATSTNQTVSQNDEFQSNNFNLDYAYAKHKWDNGTSLTLGQHKNPYISSSLLWDTDVRFVGATGQWADEDSGLFVTGGAYVVQTFATANNGENDDANLIALQAGMKSNGFTVAGSYYHFDSAATADAIGAATGDDDIQLASLYAAYSGKTDSFDYTFWGEYTVNIGANDGTSSQAVGNQEDESVSFAIGTTIGVEKWKFKYAYAHFESDSAYGPLTDADFGASVSNSTNSNNVEGHILSASYKLSKNLTVGAKYIMAEEIEGNGNSSSDGELFQFDLQYKF